MNSRSIGKLISVSQQGIIAEIYFGLGNYINTVDGIFFIGEVGSYITIYDIGRTIVGEITGVVEKPDLSNAENAKPNSNRQVYISLIGEITSDRFYFGVSKMPLMFSEINIISVRDLKIMLEVSDDEMKIDEDNTRATLLPIGKSVVFPDYDVKVNIDKFFGFHFAVFGNTGSGKSNTIAKIIQNIYKKQHYSAKGSKFVFIDSNGEYEQAFSKLNEVNSDINIKTLVATDEDIGEKKLEIPVWALTADDWSILLHATEKTQVPILKRAIDLAKIFFDPNNRDNKVKNHILASTLLGIINSSDSSPSKSDKLKAVLATFHTGDISLTTVIDNNYSQRIQKLTLLNAINIDFGRMNDEQKAIEFLKQYLCDDIGELIPRNTTVVYSIEGFYQAVQFATLYEGSISSQRIQEYTSTLVTRLQALQDGIQGKILTKTKFNSVDGYVKFILGNNQIVNIDVSILDDSSAEVVTKVLAKLLLDYLKKIKPKANMPINFVIEEAHRFVKNESFYNPIGYNIFERIAKEGRKFGLLLGILSQRPSELSKTVVSQCSNFIVHRVQNPDDLQYISKMVPYINKGIIDRLTFLQTGNALVFGTAINLPTLTKFDEASPKPDSDNAKISEKWYIA